MNPNISNYPNKYIRPLQQGQLDYLCGLYAAVNAIRYVDRYCSQKKNLKSVLGDLGFAYLADKEWLAPAVRCGMKLSRQRKLSRHLIAEYNSRYVAKLSLNRFDLDGCLRSFIASETSNGRPVIVCFGGGMEHYSVVIGLDEKRMLLFDSNGRKWIKVASIGFKGPTIDCAYKIYRKSVFSIGLEDKELSRITNGALGL